MLPVLRCYPTRDRSSGCHGYILLPYRRYSTNYRIRAHVGQGVGWWQKNTWGKTLARLIEPLATSRRPFPYYPRWPTGRDSNLDAHSKATREVSYCFTF